MGKTVNIDDLKRVSTQYDPLLRMLPYNELAARLISLGIRFISTEQELREVELQRKGGMAKPYVPGAPQIDYVDESMRLREAILKPEWGYPAIKENIMNYEAVEVISNSPDVVDPVNKKHPLELTIIQNTIKTVGEDILDALYGGERDVDDKSPFGLFNGIDNLIDSEIAEGKVSISNGNQFNTGAIVKPANASDTTAYDQIVAFLRNADRFLRKFGILKMTYPTYFHIADALRNKLKVTDLISDTVIMQNLIADAGITQSMKLSLEDEMGTGDRIILTVPDNLDFSLWTQAAGNFVQVRNPYEDPNDAQFWMQFKGGTRIRSIHKKNFLVNDGTPVKSQLSGDYLS